jgi:hypothetical protein
MILELRLSTVSSYFLSKTILYFLYFCVFDFKFECHLNEKNSVTKT